MEIISQKERDDLKDIRSWDDAIVRPCDKGIRYVVDDIVSYDERVKKEILNPPNDIVVDDPSSEKVNSKSKDWVDKPLLILYYKLLLINQTKV